MRIGVMFPSEESFYEGMARELFENYDSVKKLFEKTKRISGVDLKGAVIYGTSRTKWNFITRSVAVLTASVAMYRLWEDIYSVSPVCYIGDGVGMLSALVCAGDVSFESALRFIMDSSEKFKAFLRPSGKVISYFDDGFLTGRKDISASAKVCLNAKMDVEKLEIVCQKHQIDCMIEIGPGCRYTDLLGKDKEVFLVYLDHPEDQNYILENFEYGKHFNNAYILKKILGIAVCTQNFNDGEGYEEEVVAPYNKVYSLVEKYNRDRLQNSAADISDGEVDESVSLLKKILRFKMTPKEEVQKRIEMLQNETAVDFRPKFKDFFA